MTGLTLRRDPSHRTSIARRSWWYPRSSRVSQRRIECVCIGFLVWATVFAVGARAETWTSLTGNKSVQAELVGVWDNHAILRLTSGRRVSVPMDSLVAESRIQAEKIAERLTRERNSLSNELRQVAAAEAAAAPDPLPVPPEAIGYPPIKAGMEPAAVVSRMQDQIAGGHLAAVFDALPPSYQSQLNELVALAMTKVNPDAWNSSFTPLYQLADLLVTRQNWIVSHPRLRNDAQSGGDLNEKGQLFKTVLLPISNVIRAALPPDAMTTESIQTASFGKWLRERDAAMAPYLAELMKESTTSGIEWEVSDIKEETAVLKKSAPVAAGVSSGRASGGATLDLKKVEGYWLPASIADEFPAWVERHKTRLGDMAEGTATVEDLFGGLPAVAAPVSSNPISAGPSSGDFGPPDDMDMESSYDEGMEDYDDFSGSGPGSSEPIAVSLPPELVGTVLQVMPGISGMMGQLESATDATTFHQALESIFVAGESMFGMFRGMMPAGRKPRGRF